MIILLYEEVMVMSQRDMKNTVLLGQVGMLQQWLYLDTENTIEITTPYGINRIVGLRDDCKVEYMFQLADMPCVRQLWSPQPLLSEWMDWVKQLEKMDPKDSKSDFANRMEEIQDAVVTTLWNRVSRE